MEKLRKAWLAGRPACGEVWRCRLFLCVNFSDCQVTPSEAHEMLLFVVICVRSHLLFLYHRRLHLSCYAIVRRKSFQR
jgi:hypothetical protein